MKKRRREEGLFDPETQQDAPSHSGPQTSERFDTLTGKTSRENDSSRQSDGINSLLAAVKSGNPRRPTAGDDATLCFQGIIVSLQ